MPENVYCGRSFREAYSASKELCAELVIISAGLGLIRPHDEIPGYSLTVSNGREDSIKDRITDRNYSPKLWWKALASNTSASTSLVDIIKDTDASLVLIALTESYAHMLFDELERLEEGILGRLRVFGAGLTDRLPSQVAETIMPYDVRLNGADSPLRGTMSDFGSRAIRHYANCFQSGLIDGSSIKSDRHALSQVMSDWAIPEVPKRARLSDKQVIDFILKNWDTSGGRSGITLSLLRGCGYACEQSRFKDLFREARELQVRARVRFA